MSLEEKLEREIQSRIRQMRAEFPTMPEETLIMELAFEFQLNHDQKKLIRKLLSR